MDNLKPCPCGKTPTKLYLRNANQGRKWAWCSGDCCDEWNIEFRTQYEPYDSDECYKLAVEAWNEAKRG